jgi:phage shock protein E
MKSIFTLAALAGLLLAAPFNQAQNKDSKPAAASTIVKNVDINEAEKLVKEKKVTVLDIRTPKEFVAGHIAGATNINFNDAEFARKLESLDKSKSYLVHCAAGGRSGRSLEAFRKLNFQTIYHMDKGLGAWEKAGKPLEK